MRTALEGSRRVGIPWQTIGAFLRISTHPRLFERPLTSAEAWHAIKGWLDAPACWIPTAGERTAHILGELLTSQDVRGNLITDAQLAALAIEHGLPVVSADSDFARFRGLGWINPLAS
jgi:toxin-antitoxin system PIN domain toxin